MGLIFLRSFVGSPFQIIVYLRSLSIKLDFLFFTILKIIFTDIRADVLWIIKDMDGILDGIGMQGRAEVFFFLGR